MFHLDNNSGVSAMPPVGTVQSSAPRWFTEGGGGTPASYPGAAWYNIIQAELLNFLSAYGIAPDKADLSQLQKAIEAAIKDKATAKSPLLTAIAALVTSADKMPYFNGKDTVAMTALTAFAREVLAQTDAVGVLSKLGLTAIATVAGKADNFPYFSSDNAAKLTPLTEFARRLLGRADAIDMRSTLELKNSATRDVGTASGTVAAGNDSRFGLMVGVGQTWQNVLASRVIGVTYTNSTGRPIVVSISATVNQADPTCTLSISGANMSSCAGTGWPAGLAIRGNLLAIIPDGTTYSVSGAAQIMQWSELR